MTQLDHPIEHDGKAGYSSMCRRGDHRTCLTSRAICTCDCHGPNGQQPPAPKEPPMSEPHLAAVPTPEPPVLDRGEFACPRCDFVAGRQNGLSRHLNQTHGITAKKPATRTPQSRPAAPAVKPPAAATQPPAPKAAPVADTNVVIVVENGQHLVAHRCATSNVAALREILSELGHTTWIARPE